MSKSKQMFLESLNVCVLFATYHADQLLRLCLKKDDALEDLKALKKKGHSDCRMQPYRIGFKYLGTEFVAIVENHIGQLIVDVMYDHPQDAYLHTYCCFEIEKNSEFTLARVIKAIDRERGIEEMEREDQDDFEAQAREHYGTRDCPCCGNGGCPSCEPNRFITEVIYR